MYRYKSFFKQHSVLFSHIPHTQNHNKRWSNELTAPGVVQYRSYHAAIPHVAPVFWKKNHNLEKGQNLFLNSVFHLISQRNVWTSPNILVWAPGPAQPPKIQVEDGEALAARLEDRGGVVVAGGLRLGSSQQPREDKWGDMWQVAWQPHGHAHSAASCHAPGPRLCGHGSASSLARPSPHCQPDLTSQHHTSVLYKYIELVYSF